MLVVAGDRAAAGCDTRAGSSLRLSLLALAGEWLGRYLFFVSVVPKNIAAAFTSGERSSSMNWKRTLGLDNLSEEYAFARDESTGYTSAKKIPDHWVPTTCGYCSVGCGMEIGVKDGRAVASRPFAAHPVNRGKLCPKGLSEHYTIRSRESRQVSAAAQERQAGARRAGTKRWP